MTAHSRTRRVAALGAAAALLGTTLATMSACTYESEKLGQVSGSGTATSGGLPTVDLSTVAPDAKAAALVPADLRAKGTWVIASDTTYPPAEFMDPANGQTPVGYDIDLITAVAKVLGLKADVQTAQFDGILGGIGSKYDASISSFIINTKRLAAVDMVEYLHGGSALAAVKGNPENLSVDTLCGHTIGVQTGSTQETKDLPSFDAACTSAGKPAIKPVKYATQDAVTTALIGGKLDGMLAGNSALGYGVVQTGGAYEMVGGLYSTDVEGIVLPKGSPMSQAVRAAVQKLIDDGTYARILRAWGQESSAITTARVNPKVS